MKGFLRSKLTQTVAAFLIIAAAIVVPLSGNIKHSFADSGFSIQKSANPVSTVNSANTIQAISVYDATHAWTVGSYEDTDGILHDLIEFSSDGGATWTSQTGADPGVGNTALYGVKALSATNIWAVGAYVDADFNNHTLIEHSINGGATWTHDTGSDTVNGYLYGIDGDSSTGDAWTVGILYGGTHQNGEPLTMQLVNGHFVKQTNVTLDDNLNVGISLQSISERNSSDIWAVGYKYTGGVGETTYTMHYGGSGSGWSEPENESPNYSSTANGNTLTGVTTIGTDDAWAVGYSYSYPDNIGTLMHWNGSSWSTTPLTTSIDSAFSTQLLSVTATSSNSIWAVGQYFIYGAGAFPLVWHSSDGGTHWTQAQIENPTNSRGSVLYGITSIPASGNLLTVGSYSDYENSNYYGKTLIEQYTPSSTPSVNVTVTTSGTHFILSNNNKNAALPLHIHVANSDGSPVSGASIRLSNTNGSLAVSNPITDSNGNLDAPLTLTPTTLTLSTDGDFVSEVIATVNGTDFSSGSKNLYHAVLINSMSSTPLTQSEVVNYQRHLFVKYMTDPGLDSLCPGGVGGYPYYCFAQSLFDALANITISNNAYTPQAGDLIASQVYLYSATNMTDVYLLYQNVNVNGYKYVEWNENESHFAPWESPDYITRSSLIVNFASPVTVLAISPTGKRVGYDPTTHSEVFDFPAAISNAGDEPYELVIPNPVQGQYTYQVTGTGNGTYTMTIQSLDNAGNGGSITTIHGVAAIGVTDTYLVTYSASSTQPMVVVRKVTIDIKPGEDPPAINPNSTGVIPVAILSTPTFDATKVSLTSIRFGPANAHAVDKQLNIVDVNGDGLPDVVFHFVTNQTGIKAGNTQACLSGQTTTSANVMGCDVIRTVTSGS